jgi:hypothetical protein
MNTIDHSSLRLFRTASALQWLALPLIALQFASSWQQMPSRVATHFDMANHANGWMSREETAIIFLALAAVFAITGTWITSRVTHPDPAAWGLVGLFYVILLTLIWATQSVIAYNVDGTPVNVAPLIFVGMFSSVALVILVLTTRRGAQLQRTRVLAEETHASPAWAAVLGMPSLLFVWIINTVPIAGVRLSLGIAFLMMLGATAMAWSGFHYIFSQEGLEIRTLGFRLRSIAARDIRNYVVDRWNVMGGYGIRGVGNRRAYVWGKNGVRIQTNTGEVFLGHSDPQKVIRDLDMIMRSQRGPEATRT